MDVVKKKKSGKSEFENAIKGNEEIRAMTYHAMTFEQLEEKLTTNISDSKIMPCILLTY